jgi:hypothetical protein
MEPSFDSVCVDRNLALTDAMRLPKRSWLPSWAILTRLHGVWAICAAEFLRLRTHLSVERTPWRLRAHARRIALSLPETEEAADRFALAWRCQAPKDVVVFGVIMLLIGFSTRDLPFGQSIGSAVLCAICGCSFVAIRIYVERTLGVPRWVELLRLRAEREEDLPSSSGGIYDRWLDR